MIIEVEQPAFLLDKNNPTNISYNNEDGDNWKSIIVQTYLHGFPPIKEDEILYKYKNRGYIGKSYEFNKKYTDGDIEYEYSKLGKNTLLGIYYRGDNDPVRKIDKFIRSKVSTENYTEYVDMNMDNPWVRIIVIGSESKFLFSD
jgi:hypothetical protein